MTSQELEFASADGLRLKATAVTAQTPKATVVLTHGGGVTRDEGGFFTRLAAALAVADLSSLRFDFRAHGESEGRQQDVTLAGVANDIRAAVDRATEDGAPVALLAASFSGGIAAMYASRYPPAALVLLNPLIDYRKRFIDEKPYWREGYLSQTEAAKLAQDGAIQHSPTFALGRALLNEVFYFDPRAILSRVTVPTLIAHGTGDTFISVTSSRTAVTWMADASLIEIEGAQHGFAVHDDPEYRDPRTQEWQSFVAREVAAWLGDRVDGAC